jgi:hypothetical protein
MGKIEAQMPGEEINRNGRISRMKSGCQRIRAGDGHRLRKINLSFFLLPSPVTCHTLFILSIPVNFCLPFIQARPEDTGEG